MDLFEHAAQADLKQRAAADREIAKKRYQVLLADPAARAQRRQLKIAFAFSLIQEARSCNRRGWQKSAAFWINQAGAVRREAVAA